MKEKQKCSKNIKATAKMETIRQGLRKASGFRKHAASVHCQANRYSSKD